MRYHKGKRFGLCEAQQSYFYWMCQNFERLAEEEKAEIRKAAEKACRDPSLIPAVLEVLTTDRTLTATALRHYTSESALQRCCKKFYRAMAERFLEKAKEGEL